MSLVTPEEIHRAADRIRDVVLRTPLLPCPWAERTRPLWLKPENLQPTGAFKLRGAQNAIRALPQEVAARGVVAYSSGNHAQAVASAAASAGIGATIVIEDSAPRVKIEATREFGAEVVTVPMPEREATARRLAEERDATLIPPFDHRDVIAGQGTIGLEIMRDLPELDLVLVPISGGGLVSGIAAAVKALRPEAAVFAVEPELAADARDSMRAGHLVDWPVEQRRRTIADGLRAQPSELTFAHLLALVDGVVTVSEQEIRQAVGLLAMRARIVAEPSGAVATAAYLHRADELPAGRTVSVVSGGNTDPALLADILRE
ncbi:MAG: threonine ammonia-lyase [Sciscionella sp.]